VVDTSEASVDTDVSDKLWAWPGMGARDEIG
jgi:hypothetical protein